MIEFYFDDKNYNEAKNTLYRRAVRAIILQSGKIAMIRSKKYGEYKFPGGGVLPQEDLKVALVREVEEETGLGIVFDSISGYLKAVEKRKDLFSDAIFHQTSYYYLCEVKEGLGKTNLSGYEIEYGYELVWVLVEEAYQNNVDLLKYNDKIGWIQRETEILKYLMQE